MMRIAETFESIQGEGDLSGLPMFFVRASGCSVAACPLHPVNSNLCDTDWNRKTEVTIEELARSAKRSGIHWVCVTGGEPTDQISEITEFAAELHKSGHRVMLQTSGIRVVPDCWDWLVVSPKTHVDLLQQKSGHELKLVWNGESIEYLREMAEKTRFLRYFLQPLDRGDGTSALAKLTDVVMECARFGLPYRLSVQQHKLWGGK